MLDSLRDIPIVGDVRGAGYFQAIELVKDQDDQAVVQRRGVRDAAARLPLGRALRARPHLPRRRPRRPGRHALAAADRRARAVRGDRERPAPGPRRGLTEDARRLMLTVRELLRDLEVGVLTGEPNLDAPVRWVHISELADPTPWLSGGELLLTTGLSLSTAQEQRAYIARLADHGLAGLGFGVGFGHEKVPEALVEAAAERDFPRHRDPLRHAVHRRSPRRRSRGWSTSSTRCCSARSPSRSACSGSCSPSAASTRSPRRSRR